jgi:hypothetical protein
MRENDEFYVGYLPVPAGQSCFLRRIVAVLLLGVATIGVAFAIGQRDPGPAVWQSDSVQTFNGVVRLHPYPTLEMSSPGGRVTSLLLVDQGKRGVLDRVRDLDGRHVSVHGHRLQRESLQLIELADEANPITIAGELAAPASGPAVRPDRVTLQGEIIDPKCHGGTMKPGDGKTHKACAVLCIRGGIPPIFASPLTDGSLRYYVILDRDGRPLSGESLEAILPFVADPVQVIGDIGHDGDHWQIRLSAADIRRL